MTHDSRPTTLVIQTAFLGDVVLTTPLLAALATQYGPVDIVTTAAAAPLVETHPAVDTVWRYDKRGADRGWAGFRRLARGLRARRYARVFLPHRSWRSAGLALAARIPDRIGFANGPAAVTYTRRITRWPTGHESDRLLALAGDANGARGESAGTRPAVRLGLTSEDRAAAAAWLASHGVNDRFVALAPGSIWGTKRWPYYAELAARLPGPIVLVGGPEDAALADAVVRAAPGRAHSAAGALGLRASAALIEQAAALVTNDSAPLHLATAVRTPIVALFGPTIPAFGFGPVHAGDVALGVDNLPCRPCSAHGPRVCPLGHHRCLRELDVTTVAAAVEAVIRTGRPRATYPGN